METVEELEFDVIYASGKAKEDHSNHQKVGQHLLEGKGWVSKTKCHFPQELIIKFKTRCNLKKIQILADHKFVPTSVHIDMADFEDALSDDPKDISWDEMGTGAFQDQAKIEKPSRELKTIFVDVYCLYLRLILPGCYENAVDNPFNQVGIMAIELFGHHLDKTAHHEHHDLIKLDKQKRIQRIETAKRAGTAKERHLLEKDYVREIARVVSMLENKLNISQDKEHKAKIKDAIQQIAEVREEAELLMNCEKEALKEHDEIYAEACEKHIIKKYNLTASMIRLEDMLDSDQIDTIKLTKANSIDGKEKGTKKATGQKKKVAKKVKNKSQD